MSAKRPSRGDARAGPDQDDGRADNTSFGPSEEGLRRLAARMAGSRPLHGSGTTDLDDSPDALGDDWAFFRAALPEYDVKERIHYGGQGVVYRAFHHVTKRYVAIKVLLDGPLSSPRQKRRLTREIELIGRLRHPDIVTLYEAGEVRGRPYLVMEYVDGLPIDDHVLLHDLSVRRIVRVFRRICRAVASAHECGVIHRDIKPANILVDADDKPSVLDFGLARDADAGGNSVSLTGQIVGTLPYLSPEQARGDNDEIDARSDIYSLGVVLFELITGTHPYPVDGSVDSVRANILSRDPVSLRKALGNNTCDRPNALRDLNDDLEKIVAKALAKEKERRYRSAAALADDLDRYLAGDAVEAKSESSFYVLRKSVRRFRLQVAAGAVVIVVAASASIWVIAARLKTQQVARIAATGLQMGGLVRLGSSHAGAGRVEQAMALLESAVDIGATVPLDDRAALRYRFEALHQLAELNYDAGDQEKADHYATIAIELAGKILAKEPDNAEWIRLQGFSYRLKGRAAMAREDWPEALAAFDRSVAIRADMLTLEPDNPSLRAEMASMLGLRGDSFRHLERYDEAYNDLKASLAIWSELARLSPDVAKYSVELARADGRIGVFHRCADTAEADAKALKWLDKAAERLIRLRDSGEGASQARTIGDLLDAIQDNREFIQNRIEQRAGNPS